jgi:hypothetical protein
LGATDPDDRSHARDGRKGIPVALSLSPEQRKLRARAAAYAMHAQGKTNTRAATVAQLSRYARQVDPDGVLDPAERGRRAKFAMKAFMASMSLKASRAATKRNGTSVNEPSEIPSLTEVRDASDRPSV